MVGSVSSVAEVVEGVEGVGRPLQAFTVVECKFA